MTNKVILLPYGPSRENDLLATYSALKLDIRIIIINDSGKNLPCQITGDDRVSVYSNDRTLGLTSSLLKYYDKYAYYDLIYRLDTGSRPSPERFAIQEQYLLSIPQAAICAARTQFFVQHLSDIQPLYQQRYFSPNTLESILYRKNPIAHSSIAIRGSFFRKLSGYSKLFKQSQDLALYLSFLSSGYKICMTREVCHQHVFSKKNSTTLNKNRRTRGFSHLARFQYAPLYKLFLPQNLPYTSFNFFNYISSFPVFDS